MKFIIQDIKDSNIILQGTIIGCIRNQILIFNPCIAFTDGKEELFILPEFKTDPLTSYCPRISFRQINMNLDLGQESLIFHGVTTDPINYEDYEFKFLVDSVHTYEITCTIGETVPQIHEKIMPIFFNCHFQYFEDFIEYVLYYSTIPEEIFYIESSEDISGLPPNKSLLDIISITNEYLEGLDNEINTTSVPILVESPSFDYSLIKNGILSITFTYSGDIGDIEGKSFNIYLKVQSKIEVTFNVTQVKNSKITIQTKFEDYYKNQTIKCEQSVVFFEGKELFVIPEFETSPITINSAFLSFRQINSFEFNREAKEGTFKFYGVTTKPINNKDLTIKFGINIAKDGNSEEIEATCVIGKTIPLMDEKIKSAFFDCKFPLPFLHPYSIRIESSQDVLGLPSDKSLLELLNVDSNLFSDKINEIKPESKSPILVESPIFNYNSTNEYIFNVTFTYYGNIGEIEGKTFSMNAKEPYGVIVNFDIIEIKESSITIQAKIDECIENQTLIFEQSVAFSEQKELFVIPRFETEPISVICEINYEKEEENEISYEIELEVFKEDKEVIFEKEFYKESEKEKEFYQEIIEQKESNQELKEELKEEEKVEKEFEQELKE